MQRSLNLISSRIPMNRITRFKGYIASFSTRQISYWRVGNCLNSSLLAPSRLAKSSDLISIIPNLSISTPAARNMSSSSSATLSSGNGAPPPPLAYFSPPSVESLSLLRSRPPQDLRSFLVQCRSFLDLGKVRATAQQAGVGKARVHVILGNEASDMDSMVCSVVLAWYLTHVFPPSTGNIFLPFTNCLRKEFNLRGEAGFSFAAAGVPNAKDVLLFKEEFPLDQYASEAELALILVDHNHLSAEQSRYGDYVVAIVDHHKDEQLYPRTNERGNRIMEILGSCTSLVGDLILTNAPYLLSADAFEHEIDYQHNYPPTPLGIINLLYHVLLLDTNNMSDVTKKYRERDVKVHKAYLEHLQNLTYEELKRRRTDVSQLNTEQLLMKDTKYGENAKYPHMVCSVPISLPGWGKKDSNVIAGIEHACREKSLRFVVSLCSGTNHATGEYKREILVVVPRDSESQAETWRSKNVLNSQALFEALKGSFEGATKDLNCAADDSLLPEAAKNAKHNAHVQCYVQRNLGSSRKQVAPLMASLLSKL